jgi:rhodanese-related sulfurtransferase
MGPLVPDVITNELNLIVAGLIGLGFGYILEQAGFSSSRKLTGLFYGTDFTVLRVFFTAGATAMTGVLLLEKLGWLDTSIIFVNPTFLHSAILGGLVMGVGFVLGGYCPGTSLCGLSVGRVDAFVFVLGSFLGVFAFGEAYPRIKGLYMAGSWGDLTVPAALGVSPGFVLALTVGIALTAFGVTGRIERRVNPATPHADAPVWLHRFAGAGLLVAAVLVAVLPSTRERLEARAGDSAYRAGHPVTLAEADEIAFRILDKDANLQIIDVREPQVFTKSGLPGAVNIPAGDLFSQAARATLTRTDRQQVFVADDEAAGVAAATIARELGAERVSALRGGLRGFQSTVLNLTPPPDALTGSDRDTWAFRLDAAPKLAALIQARSEAKPVAKKVKKIAGGCGL